MRVRETSIVPITNLSTSSLIDQFINNKVKKNKMWRHNDSAVVSIQPFNNRTFSCFLGT